MKKILVIAPHPDDEVLGCGGTIKKYVKAGDEVFLGIVTKAYAPDWSEKYMEDKLVDIKKSNAVLGFKKTYFLDLPTVKLDTIPRKELNDKIRGLVKEVDPDILFIPHVGDLNHDHRLVFEACLVAARPTGNKIKKILAYETLSEASRGAKQFTPNAYMDITKTLKDKLKAIACYKSELQKYPHPRSLEGITALAKKRGTESGLLAAEAFMVIREILS
ncbi:MAG: PIG-L family deacetylase [Patescibacteria group bacterium]|nr:PIG-L family deacetylase [Patescibacteria group bacterium]